jgi:hypothetical protein
MFVLFYEHLHTYSVIAIILSHTPSLVLLLFSVIFITVELLQLIYLHNLIILG